MGRVSAFLKASNGSRDITMGGRRGDQDQLWVTLNTDNGTFNDCAVEISCQVTGERNLYGKPRSTCHACRHHFKNGVKRADGSIETGFGSEGDADIVRAGDVCPECGELRQGQDNRVSNFDISIPEQDDGYCKVHLNGQNVYRVMSDDDVVEQVKRRGLYDRIVKELFGGDPLIESMGALQEAERALA